MGDEIKQEYKYQKGNLLLVPYSVEAKNLPEDVLLQLYNKLKSEDLWDIVFHEATDFTLLKFMNFFSGGGGLLQILVVTDGKGFYDSAGMAWIGDLALCAGKLTRGTGSFVFFKDYQRPAYTDTFCDIILDFWYNNLGLDIILGVTPEPNRPALLYIKRSGFKELARIPNYTTYAGEVVAGVVTSMTKAEYKALSEG